MMPITGIMGLNDFQDYVRTKMTGKINTPLPCKVTGCAMTVHHSLAQAKNDLQADTLPIGLPTHFSRGGLQFKGIFHHPADPINPRTDP